MTIITNQADFDKFLLHCKEQKFVALDTEFIRKNTYFPILSLIQIASKEQVGVIDMLETNFDLGNLIDLLNSETIKIIHSARQDLEILSYISNDVPKNIYDTQIAMSVITNQPQIGYEKMVKEYLNIEISKEEQKSNWLKRPLSDDMLEYVKNDVLYLLPCYELINQKIIELKRVEIFSQLMQQITNKELYLYDSEDAWKKINISYRDLDFVPRIKFIAKFREEIAREKNLPKGWILKDREIINLAKNPKQQKIFVTSRYFKNKSNSYKNEFCEEIAKISIINDEIREDDSFPKEIIEIFKIIRNIRAEKLCIVPNNLMKNEIFENLTKDKLLKSEVMQGFRKDELGIYLEKFLDGKISISIENDQFTIKEK